MDDSLEQPSELKVVPTVTSIGVVGEAATILTRLESENATLRNRLAKAERDKLQAIIDERIWYMNRLWWLDDALITGRAPTLKLEMERRCKEAKEALAAYEAAKKDAQR